MAIAIALVVMVAASVLFHFLSPWWATPLASNWKQMDDTLTITLVITGAFFIGINLFLGYMVWRYRHRESHGEARRDATGAATGAATRDGHRAAYAPTNHKLELWLIAGTTLLIVALLAPGLFVYADYVRAPREAMVVEVVGQQWAWSYRFPGPGGRLGTTDVRFVGPGNPLGLNPDDPDGQDDIVIAGGDLHLPLGRPVRVLARSKDVLHDFYVPEFRARMNMVPGMVTSFWFTPTREGRFDVLCAQLCGVGHHNMRGGVRVEAPAAFAAWLQGQPTFAAAKTVQPPAAATVPATGAAAAAGAAGLAEQGRALAQSKGCVACHSVDGAPGVGPTWKDLFGHAGVFTDGSSAKVDDDYLRTEIREPQARVVKGFAPIMPKMPLSDEEVEALVAYIRSLSAQSADSTPGPGKAAR